MRFYKIVPAVIVTFVGIASSTAVSAEETGPAKSQAIVEIQPGDTTTPTDPIDPEGPDKPTGQVGNLTIDYVSSLDFGSFQLQSESVTLKANQNREKDPKVQVTDKRGTGEGWTLTVAQTKEFKSTKGHTLAGAKLTLPVGNLKTNNINKESAPSTKSVVVNAEPNIIMTAAKDQGLGTWVDEFARENTTLEIPAGNYAGIYESELTWTLSNAPQE
ncbi:WxL domain-containing protein [Bacillus paramobilis]|uniref:WxL domain-containing protein n=1 Tax=Bacillus paramobilis TaxID=2817477 RepID=UPI003D20FE3A